VEGQETVGVPDLLRHPRPEEAALQSVLPRRADAALVEHDIVGAVDVVDRAGELRRILRLDFAAVLPVAQGLGDQPLQPDDVRVRVAEVPVVPGAIEQQDDALLAGRGRVGRFDAHGHSPFPLR